MVDRSRRDSAIAKKILKEIDDIRNFTIGMSVSDFCSDEKSQKAVAVTLINIGELSKAFTADFIERHKDIPWKDIQATRNIAAHKYESIDMQIIWETIVNDLPSLQKVMEDSVTI